MITNEIHRNWRAGGYLHGLTPSLGHRFLVNIHIYLCQGTLVCILIGFCFRFVQHAQINIVKHMCSWCLGVICSLCCIYFKCL